jgi:hypothetical protein
MAHSLGIITDPFSFNERIRIKWLLAKEQTLVRMWIYALKGTVRWNRN